MYVYLVGFSALHGRRTTADLPDPSLPLAVRLSNTSGQISGDSIAASVHPVTADESDSGPTAANYDAYQRLHTHTRHVYTHYRFAKWRQTLPVWDTNVNHVAQADGNIFSSSVFVLFFFSFCFCWDVLRNVWLASYCTLKTVIQTKLMQLSILAQNHSSPAANSKEHLF